MRPVNIARAVLLSLIVAVAGSAQVRLTGTFITATVTNDGVIVASDSRTTFLDAGGHPFAYLDGMPKIFVNQGTAVAVSGLTSLGDELLSSFVHRSSFLLERTPDEILFDFALHLPFQNTTGVAMLSAGFLDGQATVCGKNPNDPQRCTKSGYFSNKVSAVLNDGLARLGHIPTPTEAAAIMKQAIQSSAAAEPTVGGPISILHLRKGAPPVWIENEATDNGWTRICDLVNAHRHSRVVIHPIGTSAQELDRHFAQICP
jgi:hypothetical protein